MATVTGVAAGTARPAAGTPIPAVTTGAAGAARVDVPDEAATVTGVGTGASLAARAADARGASTGERNLTRPAARRESFRDRARTRRWQNG